MKTSELFLAVALLSIASTSCSHTQKELNRVFVPLMETALDEYVTDAEENRIPLDAVVVLQHGKVIGERYINGWPKDSVHHMWSTSKSYTSLAVGFAEKEGLLSLEDKVCDYFPEIYGPHIDESEQGRFIADGTIRDYLVMATGQEKDPTFLLMMDILEKHPDIIPDDNLRYVSDYYDTEGTNAMEGLFIVPFTKRPGSQNLYNSIASHVLSAIVQKVTGQKTVDYLQSRLWEPLGAKKPEWMEIGGVSAGGWGLMLDAETMAKTGQMLLDGGKYAGKQVVPAEYLEEASTAYFAWGAPTNASPEEAPSYHQGYGYQFWVNGDGYNTAGAQGQVIIVLPKYDAVIVGIADIKDDDHKENALIWKHIVPVLKQLSVTQISMADFGLTPDDPSDATNKIRKAFNYCKSLGAPVTLSFLKGTYDLDCESSLLEIVGMDGFTLDGNGSKLIFHGLSGLASIKDSRNICIRGFECDWERPLISQVVVGEHGPDWFCLQMDPARYPYIVSGGHLRYICDGQEYGIAEKSYNNVFTADGSRIKPGSFDNYELRSVLEGEAEDLGNGLVRFAGALPSGVETGDIMTLYHVRYKTSMVYARETSNLVLENMTVRHSVGVAFYMAGVRDLRVENVDLTPSEGRVFTAVGDAFHIVSCSGNVRITGCNIDGQGDDAINIHGRYYDVTKVSNDGKRITLGTRRGEIILHTGDVLAYVDTLTGERCAYSKVVSMKGRNTACTKMIKGEISDTGAYAIENMSMTPSVFIASNTFGSRNRARGLLITTPRHSDIFWNTFRSAGAAILVEGDMADWFESGAVNDLNIRHNYFDKCHQSEWGRATICFSPTFHSDEYHTGVTIDDNTFILAPGDSALYYHGVKDIIYNP